MTQPVQEPTPGRDQAATDFRTRQLFRRPVAGFGGGIQFVNPTAYGDINTGDVLDVRVTDEMLLFADGDISLDGQNVFINGFGTGPADGVSLEGGEIYIDADDQVEIRAGPLAGSNGQINIQTFAMVGGTGGGIFLDDDGLGIFLYDLPTSDPVDINRLWVNGGVVMMSGGVGGADYIDIFDGGAEPGSPGATAGRLYVYDNAGTLELRVNMNGTVTTLATE